MGRISTSPLGAAALLAAAWFAASLAVNLPPFADALLGAFHLGFSLEVGAVLAVLALVQARFRRVPRAVIHALAALLVLLVAVRLGDFLARSVVDRPLNLFLDVSLLPATMDVARTLLGPLRAWGAVAALIVALVALHVLFAFGLSRLAGFFAQPVPRRAMMGLGAGALLVFAGQKAFLEGLPGWRPVGASASLAISQQVEGVSVALARRAVFREKLAEDSADGIADSALFRALDGRDVLLIFVESYGVTALDAPAYERVVAPALVGLGEAAREAGLAMRSGRMVAASAGGQSWLNHASVSSGRFIDDQTLYALFLAEDPRTLVDDFARAGYRTVQSMPAITMPWPEGQLLGYDATYEAKDMGYAGPHFYWGIVPDQFALDHLARAELDGGARPPVFAVAGLISSHAPWLPVPEVVPWDALGDGEIYRRWTDDAPAPREVWRDPDAVRVQYARSIAHSLDAVAAFVAERVDPGTIVIVMGDHQPAPLITGEDASRAVPVHVLAPDAALLEPLEALGFAAGIAPPPAPALGDVALPRIDALRPALLRGWQAGGEGAEHAAAPVNAP
ncbi:hypothetical protein [Salinarimonas ramus]|uniref:Sulfatase n=1 Tax=Salinarimonas ramus TaxID=690164 RepID=A0A917Q4N6_9HYPH|nr:hypothetical protein [Salinarimonas ramus]GGK22704.1 hypothetical protein GCM10011322_06730 [Salinarimonas ramus]